MNSQRAQQALCHSKLPAWSGSLLCGLMVVGYLTGSLVDAETIRWTLTNHGGDYSNELVRLKVALRMDMDFVVTLPGGAGQECSGSTAHALSRWLDEADLCRTQGEVGLFIPECGYDFGPVPDWLIHQRDKQFAPHR